MSFFIQISCIFVIGCSFGWLLEVIFRRFCRSSNPEGRWINPGYLKGPWLPIYGFGLCTLYLLSGIENLLSIGGILGKLILIIIMTFSVTLLELIAGFIYIDLLKTDLWDYSNEWGNFRGLICPRFAFFWGIICAIYVLFVHNFIVLFANWILGHAVFSIFAGIYLGLMLADTLGLNMSRRKVFHKSSIQQK